MGSSHADIHWMSVGVPAWGARHDRYEPPTLHLVSSLRPPPPLPLKNGDLFVVLSMS